MKSAYFVQVLGLSLKALKLFHSKKNWNGKLSIPKKDFLIQKNIGMEKLQGLVRRKSDSTSRTVCVSTVPEQLWTSYKMREKFRHFLKKVYLLTWIGFLHASVFPYPKYLPSHFHQLHTPDLTWITPGTQMMKKPARLVQAVSIFEHQTRHGVQTPKTFRRQVSQLTCNFLPIKTWSLRI